MVHKIPIYIPSLKLTSTFLKYKFVSKTAVKTPNTDINDSNKDLWVSCKKKIKTEKTKGKSQDKNP